MALSTNVWPAGENSPVSHFQCHKGKQIYNDDANSLAKFYFAMTDCLVNLERICYYSDLYSTYVLRQAIGRLPTYLQKNGLSIVIAYAKQRNHV